MMEKMIFALMEKTQGGDAHPLVDTDGVQPVQSNSSEAEQEAKLRAAECTMDNALWATNSVLLLIIALDSAFCRSFPSAGR